MYVVLLFVSTVQEQQLYHLFFNPFEEHLATVSEERTRTQIIIKAMLVAHSPLTSLEYLTINIEHSLT